MTPALTEKLVETARAARDAGHGKRGATPSPEMPPRLIPKVLASSRFPI